MSARDIIEAEDPKAFLRRAQKWVVKPLTGTNYIVALYYEGKEVHNISLNAHMPSEGSGDPEIQRQVRELTALGLMRHNNDPVYCKELELYLNWLQLKMPCPDLTGWVTNTWLREADAAGMPERYTQETGRAAFKREGKTGAMRVELTGYVKEGEDPKKFIRGLPHHGMPLFIHVNMWRDKPVDVKAKIYFTRRGFYISGRNLQEAMKPLGADEAEVESLADEVQSELHYHNLSGSMSLGEDFEKCAWKIIIPADLEAWLKRAWAGEQFTQEEAWALVNKYEEEDFEILRKYDGEPPDYSSSGVFGDAQQEAEDPKKFIQRHAPRMNPGRVRIHLMTLNDVECDLWARAYFIDEVFNLGDVPYPGVWVSSMTLAKVLGEYEPGPAPWYETHKFMGEVLATEIQNSVNEGNSWGKVQLDDWDAVIAWELVAPPGLERYLRQTQHYTREQAEELLSQFSDGDSELIKKYDGIPADWEDSGAVEEAEDPKKFLQSRDAEELRLQQILQQLELEKEPWPDSFKRGDRIRRTRHNPFGARPHGGEPNDIGDLGTVSRFLGRKDEPYHSLYLVYWDRRPWGCPDYADHTNIEAAPDAPPGPPLREAEDPKRFMQQYGRDFSYGNDGTVWYATPLNDKAAAFLRELSLPCTLLKSDGTAVLQPQYWQQFLVLAGDAGLVGRKFESDVYDMQHVTRSVQDAEDPKTFLRTAAPRLWRITYEMTLDTGGWSSPLTAYMRTNDKKEICTILHKHYPRAQLAGIKAVPATPREVERLRERDLPLMESVADDIAKEAAKAEQPKSQEQADAGNQKKGHIHLHGWAIAIENAKDSVRKSKDPENPWQVTMPAHYGYIKGTEGKDKDHIDVYIGEHPTSMLAFVVNQVKKEGGAFDEHKIMLGFKSKDEAIATYDKAFNGDLGPKLRKSVISATIDQVKHWLEKGDPKKEYANLEEAEDPKNFLKKVLPRLRYTNPDGLIQALNDSIDELRGGGYDDGGKVITVFTWALQLLQSGPGAPQRDRDAFNRYAEEVIEELNRNEFVIQAKDLHLAMHTLRGRWQHSATVGDEYSTIPRFREESAKRSEAEALLDAEDPKEFFKRVMPRNKLPERAVTITVTMRDGNAFAKRCPVTWEKHLVMTANGWKAGIDLHQRAPKLPYIDDDEWDDVLSTVAYHIMEGPHDPVGELDYVELHGDDYDGRIHKIEWRYHGHYEIDQDNATEFLGGVVPFDRFTRDLMGEAEDPKDVLKRATAAKAARLKDMLHLFKDTVYVRSVPKGDPPVMLRGIDKFCLSDAEPEPHVFTILDLEQEMAWHRKAWRLEDGGVHGERLFKSEPNAIGAQIDWEKLVSQIK